MPVLALGISHLFPRALAEWLSSLQEASELKRELEEEASQHAAATRPPQEHSTAKLGTLSPHTPRGRTALSLAKSASPGKATQPKGLMATKAEVIKSIWSQVRGAVVDGCVMLKLSD